MFTLLTDLAIMNRSTPKSLILQLVVGFLKKVMRKMTQKTEIIELFERSNKQKT